MPPRQIFSAIAATSVTVPSLPAKAAKVYARLYSDVYGVTQYIDYTYTGAGTPAAMISPVQGARWAQAM